jgi:hypothetical protein
MNIKRSPVTIPYPPCELTLQDVIDNKCQYWGPRYTEGLFPDQVEQAHSMGIKVYSWTLNDKNLIVNYLKMENLMALYPIILPM